MAQMRCPRALKRWNLLLIALRLPLLQSVPPGAVIARLRAPLSNEAARTLIDPALDLLDHKPLGALDEQEQRLLRNLAMCFRISHWLWKCRGRMKPGTPSCAPTCALSILRPIRRPEAPCLDGADLLHSPEHKGRRQDG